MKENIIAENIVKLKMDGDKWCALIGANLQEGEAGFGDTRSEALVALALNLARQGM